MSIEDDLRAEVAELRQVLRHAATVLVSAGPALVRACQQSPNDETLRLNTSLRDHAEQAYAEARVLLDRTPAEDRPTLRIHDGERATTKTPT